MSVERKCPKCGTWNKANDFCTNCGEAISPQQIQLERISKMREEEGQKAPSKMDQFLKKIKKSKNPFVKIGYILLFSVWSIYIFILGVILYLTAATPG